MTEARARREERLIFFVVLLCSVFFTEVYYQTGNYASRYFVTRAIVDHQTLRLDAYRNEFGLWTDFSYYNGHYYGNKPPGSSLMMLPQYVLFGKPAKWLVSLTPLASRQHDIAAWVTQITSLCLYSALGFLVFYRILGLLGIHNRRLQLTLLAYFGTLMFPYSTIGTGEMFTAPLLIFGIYYLLKGLSPGEAVPKSPDRNVLYSGLLFGLAFLTTNQTALFIPPAFLFLVLPRRSWKAALYFVIPTSLSCAAMLLYNYVTVDDIFAFPHKYWMGWKNGNSPYETSVPMQWPTWQHLFNLTINPAKGIFFYSPFLLLCIPGFVALSKSVSAWVNWFFISCGAAFFLFFVFFVGASGGGDEFGMRYFVPALPFLCVGACAWLSGKNLSWILATIGIAICVFGGITDPHATSNCTPLRDYNWPFFVEKGSSNLVTHTVRVFFNKFESWYLGVGSTAAFFLLLGIWANYYLRRTEPPMESARKNIQQT